MFNVSSSPHQRVTRNTSHIMQLVALCAVPGILAQTILFGYGVLIQLVLAVAVAVVTEIVLLEIRKKDFERAISDWSAIVTGLLIAVSIPPYAPWWIVVIGSFSAISIAKQLYGGLGNNIFNPAMVAYVILLISFPVQMTAWSQPISVVPYDLGFIDSLHLIFTGFTQQGYDLDQLRLSVDGITQATPLDGAKTLLAQAGTVSELAFSSSVSLLTIDAWQWVNLMYLLGGLALLKLKVINWHIPGSILFGLALFALVFYLVDADGYLSPWFHITSGGAMLGAFFIATDPVSACTTNRGRLIFGFMIGAWIYIIRTFGGYPDAVAFSVLLMNMAVPLIDYYSKPRIYGQKR